MAAKNDFAALWVDARKRYEEISHKKLENLPVILTTEDLIASVDNQNKSMKHFREKSGTLFTVLSAACKPIELVGNLAAGAASCAFPPSSMVFGAAMYLINAAKGVSASLDAITELLGTLKDFTVRLKVYNREQLSQELREKLTDILTTVIEIFARSTKVVDDGVLMRLKSFGKNVILGNDTKMQGLLGKLSKLTDSEDRLVGAETLVETKKTSRNVEAVQGQLSELSLASNGISAGVGQILSAMEEQKEDRDAKHVELIKTALRPSVSAQDRFDEIKRDHVQGSGDWIREEEAMKGWIARKSPVLWISGGPGSGKSFLTFNIINKLQDVNQEQTDAESHASVAWFFFRDNNDQTRSFDQALRDMAYQISQTDVVYAKHIADVCRSGAEVSSIRSVWQKLFVDFFIRSSDEVDCNAYLLFDGIDEAFEQDRLTFFGLLRDVEEAGVDSRLHIAMLGRPQIVDEINDELERALPTIHVDWTKNGRDIQHYIESSITKSRVLNKISKKLKAEVVETLGSKANGMFMWVRLMIAELSKKSRESAIREALNKAPRGLTEMFRHVLTGFSASIKDEQDVEDLNDMLAWVSLAKRPLYLGEIDAMLRLKSEEGDGVLNLEGKLRKQFATFFVLTRDDALTTADLQAPKKLLTPDDDVEDVDQELDDGLDDVENETDFESNPRTTTVAFAHASIGDFFRNEKEGKVTAPGDECMPVGVEYRDSQLQVLLTCLNLITDPELETRMKDAVNLKVYAAYNWKPHLEEMNPSKVKDEDKAAIAKLVVQVLSDKAILWRWAGVNGYPFFSKENAEKILHWITGEAASQQLTADAHEWVKALEGNPLDLWDPAMKLYAEGWLHPYDGPQWVVKPCVWTVHAFLKRKEGGEVVPESTMTAEEVETTARWANFEENAEWHRKLGMTLRDLSYNKEAAEHFEKSIELDPSLFQSVTGLAKTHNLRKNNEKAIELGLKALALAELDEKAEPATKKFMLYDISLLIATCYAQMANAISMEDGDLIEMCRLKQLMFEYAKKAFLLSNVDHNCLWECLGALSGFAEPPWKIKRHQDMFKNRPVPELLSKLEYRQQTMQLLHELQDTPIDDEESMLDGYLHKSKWVGDAFHIAAQAALETGELEWLQERYKHAIALANKKLQPVTAAYLGICLAELYFRYGNDTEKAIHIWETVATEGTTSSRVASDISNARSLALNSLGIACVRQALQDDSNASKWISKMERIAGRKHYNAGSGAHDVVPPSQISFYLAAWYRKQGRMEEARELMRSHIKDAIAILSDDDPNNDNEGWVNMGNALLAIGDDVNACAVMTSLRRYGEDGLCVFDDEDEDDSDNESKEADATEAKDQENPGEAGDGDEVDETKHDSGKESDAESTKEKDGQEQNENEKEEEDDDDDDDDDDFCLDPCSGVCGDYMISFDDTRVCRYCLIVFCDECHALLVKNELPLNVCGAHHEFLTIPVVKTRFTENELLVGDKVVSVEDWKANIKKEWNL